MNVSKTVAFILALIASGMAFVSASPRRSDPLQDFFQSVDTNNDGMIDLVEIRKEASGYSGGELGLDTEALSQFALRLIDINNDGVITLDELRIIPDSEAFFKTVDLSEDGKVDFDEFKAFCLKIFPDGLPGAGPEAVRESFDKIDTDGDGFITSFN